ncbi:hypothetical protein Tco_1381793 [Tanacetum coccineum]
MTQRLTLKLEAWLCRYVTLHAIYNLEQDSVSYGPVGLEARQFLFDELRGLVVNDVVTQLKVLASFLEEGEVHVVGWFFLLGVVMLLFVPLCGQARLLAVRYRVKVCWNSKRCPEFTWEREDFMKSKYPQFFVDHADESTNNISGRDFLKDGIL